ncbi:MAG: helix-turn-helix domain-containing protein [Bacteroidales bacterium]|nr:helix-turn-helix domain-containing protein [Bacteroidales bacterium]
MKVEAISVHELAEQMGISLPKAYELANRPDFPSIRVGTRILIPVDELRLWLAKESYGSK